MSSYVYLNFDPVEDWKLREAAQATAKKFVDIIESHLNTINPKVCSFDFWKGLHILNDLQAIINDLINHLGIGENYSHEYLKGLWKTCGQTTKESYREFAAQIFASVVPTAALYSHCVAQVVNFYLGEDKKSAREELVQLIKANDKAASSKALAYVHEALRQDPPVSPFWPYLGDIFSDIPMTGSRSTQECTKRRCP